MKKNLGFSLVELIIAIGIMAILFSLAYANLFAPKHRASLAASIDTFFTDLKSQQLKAMVGETEGTATHDSYGLHFESGSYTLFKGTTYTVGDSHNFIVSLGDNIQFSNVTFPNAQIVFTFDSGEVNQFAQGNNTFTVKNTVTGDQKVVTINRYGVVTQEQ